MTLQELADQSGYHRVSMARLIRENRVPGVKRKPSGRTKIVDHGKLKDWIAFARYQNERRFKNVRYHKEIAERRAKRTPEHHRPSEFTTAPEAARRLGLSVGMVRRILERHTLPEVRGKRLFYPVTPEVKSWISGSHDPTYPSRSEGISKLVEKFQRSISRLAGGLLAECRDLEKQDLQDAKFSIVALLERSREMLDDLIIVAESSDFQNSERVIAELKALSDAREKGRAKELSKIIQKFNGSIPAVREKSDDVASKD
jgi:hypothetical protein